VVFAEPVDYRYYLETLAEFKAAFGVRVYAFCLMTNHVHLLLTPDTRAVQRGQLTGSARFVNEVERIIGKRIEQRRPGRPKCEK
jgi:putative transposase